MLTQARYTLRDLECLHRDTFTRPMEGVRGAWRYGPRAQQTDATRAAPWST